MSDVNRTLTSLLLSHTICRHFWRIVVIEVSYILERIFIFLETQLITHLVISFLISNLLADFGFVATYSIYIIYVKSVWKRCPIGLPGFSNPIRRKAIHTSRLRPIMMWARLFFKLPLQHGGIYGIAVPRFASWYPPSIWKAIWTFRSGKLKIFIPTWVYSCCVRHEENRSESCRIVFPHMDVSRMGYGYCNIIYGQIRQKSLIFFVYL